MDGGGGDAFGSSTAPLTWHDFLERMRHPSAADFVKSIKSFIVSFSNKPPDPEKDSAAVQEFLANMEGAFRAHTLWAGSTEEELESAGEGLEKYVMTKLYNRAFASLPEDVEHDEELFEKIALVQKFIRPENLDIKPTYQNEASWLLAQKELQKINMYKAPRDKLVCILNCCKVINNLLLNASIALSDNPPGADEFLPVLIYVIIKANPPQLHSNLQYIQRYRCQSRLVSEAAYFFTNILSAESFIWNIDAQSISMDEAEYQRNMESARALLLGLSSNSESQGNQINEEPTEPKTEAVQTKRDISSIANKDHDGKDQQVANRPSVSYFEKHGADDLLKEDNLSRYFLDFPFLHAQASDLTTEDVENLLNNYKQLVLKYASLCRGMGINGKITESTVDSRDSGGMVINTDKHEGSTNDKYEASTNDKYEGSLNDKSDEKYEGSTDTKSNEKHEGLTNNQSSDSLFSVLDDSESKLPADDLVSRPTVEKNEAFG